MAIIPKCSAIKAKQKTIPFSLTIRRSFIEGEDFFLFMTEQLLSQFLVCDRIAFVP